MRTYSILINKEDKFVVAKNIELWVVSQWSNIEEAIENIKEATELYLEWIVDNEINYKSDTLLTTIQV